MISLLIAQPLVLAQSGSRYFAVAAAWFIEALVGVTPNPAFNRTGRKHRLRLPSRLRRFGGRLRQR
jgi:hypothetical protein